MNQNQGFPNNLDMNSLMNMLSKMDKKQLEEGLAKANKILNNPQEKNAILEELKKNQK